MHGVAGDQFTEQRIDLPCPTVEDSRPFELGEAVGQALGLGGVVELCERVVLLHEAEFLLHHLMGQPFVAVDVDLDGERQPGLQADVDQAELGIEEVVIEHSLLPGSADELGPLGLSCAVGSCETPVSAEIPTPGGPGLHYKIRSGLRRSGISSRRASKMRFCSPIGRATRRRASFWPSVVSSSMSPMAI